MLYGKFKIGVYTIVTLVNGYMRTSKIEALKRTIDWINEYIANNQNSKLSSTKDLIGIQQEFNYITV